MEFEDLIYGNNELPELTERDEEVFADLFHDDYFNQRKIIETLHPKDAVIFLVDCRVSLFHKEANEKTQFSLVLEAITSFMKSKIISSKDDKMALVLFNVREASNKLNYKGLFLVFGLEPADAERIKQVSELERNFQQIYGFSNEEQSIFQALWQCDQLFKDLNTSFTKRIFLFTNEDSPNTNMLSERASAVTLFKRFNQEGIDIELFPLEKPDKSKFEHRKFYNDVIALDIEDIGFKPLEDLLENSSSFDMSISSKLSTLQKTIKQKLIRKRHLGTVDFALFPNFKMRLKFFTMLHLAARPTPINLENNTHKRLVNVCEFICEETGSVLFKDQIGLFYPFGDEKVFFMKEDITTIKKLDNPSLRLLGFKPRKTLKPYHNLRSSYFLYPDEEGISGSSELCDALVRQLLAKDMIAIACFVPRSTSIVRLVALVPQDESFDQDDIQVPPGFNLIFLPFADDLRDLKSVKTEHELDFTHEQLVNAKVLIKSLTGEFNCRNFDNPNLQTFFANLQAIALNEPNCEPVNDLLVPDLETMDKYKDVVETFKKSIWEEDYKDPESYAGGFSRGRGRGRGRGYGRGRGRGRGRGGRFYSMKRPKEEVKKVKKSRETREEEIDIENEGSEKEEDDGKSEKKEKKKGKKQNKERKEKKSGKRGRKKKGKEEEEDDDDYDLNDGFVVGDRFVMEEESDGDDDFVVEEQDEEEEEWEELEDDEVLIKKDGVKEKKGEKGGVIVIKDDSDYWAKAPRPRGRQNEEIERKKQSRKNSKKDKI